MTRIVSETGFPPPSPAISTKVVSRSSISSLGSSVIVTLSPCCSRSSHGQSLVSKIQSSSVDCTSNSAVSSPTAGIWKLFFDAAISSVPYAFCVAEMVAVLSPAVMVIVACCCSSTLLPSQFRTSWSATSSFSMVSQPALTASYFHVVLVWMSTTTSPPRLLKPIEALRSSSAANHVFFDEMPSSAAMPDGSSPGTGLV